MNYDSIFPHDDLNRAILQAAGSAIVLADADADYALVYVNQAFERLTGYSAAEVLGRNPCFLQNDDRDQVGREDIRRALNATEPVTVTLRNYRKDGSLFFAEMRLSPLYDTAGRLTHYLGIHNDVTGQCLNQSKASRFDALVEASPLGIGMLDEQGVVVEVNDTLVEIVGAPSRAAIVGKALYEFNISKSEQAQASVAAARSGVQGVTAQLAWTSLWGKNVQAEVHFTPIHDSNQGFLAFQVIIDDMTEQVANEAKLERLVRQRTAELDTTLEELRSSEQRFQVAAAGANDGMWDWPDLQQDAQWWSPRLYELLGYAPGEVAATRQNFKTRVHADDAAAVFAAEAECIAHGEPLDVEYRVKTKTGDCLWRRARARLIRNRPGEPVRMAGSLQDVSEQRATAAALREARDQAEQATATKSRFLAAASHDLRQPLQSIAMYLAILSRPAEPTVVQDITGKMQQSLVAMQELLDALLDISKLDSGAIAAEARDFPIQDLLDCISAGNALHAEQQGLGFSVAASSAVVHSDPALLQRIVENFVANAIRHTQAGQVRVACLVAGEQARIEVSDTGSGIPADALATIFEEYVQLGNPERNRSKGLGLGLAIVKHLATVLGHAIQVESTPGEGSTFSVTLPLARSQLLAQPTLRAIDTLPVAMGDCSVLLVDDDSAIVEAAAILLEIEGFTVHAAGDSAAALALAHTGVAIDILVTDYRLPGANGVVLIQGVRAALKRELPAILLTGDTSVPEVEATDLPACALVRKPIDAKKLMQLIRTAVHTADKQRLNPPDDPLFAE